MTTYRIAFVLEQSLGHVTFGKNLQRNVAGDREVDATWIPITYRGQGRLAALPVIGGNWSVRASYRARSALDKLAAPGAFDALFMHTQVTALFSAHLLRWGNGIVSLDATPRNYDNVGMAYGHQPGLPALERLKDALNRRAFHAARHLITWSGWARDSLINDYGVPGERVTIIPPGTNLDLWQGGGEPHSNGGKMRLLFVGADFQRKGGDLLLDVYRQRLADTCELDLVTSAAVGPLPPGVRAHAGLKPNSEPLRRLFQQADVFVLPTRADCLAVVLMEAMAARLPIVATDVGALNEAVREGENGYLVPPDDGTALASSLMRLQADPAARTRMGAVGYRLAEQHFDARRNGRQLVELLKEQACRKR